MVRSHICTNWGILREKLYICHYEMRFLLAKKVCHFSTNYNRLKDMNAVQFGKIVTYSTDKTDNPKLRGRIGKSGKTVLYLEYNLGYTAEIERESEKKHIHVERRKEALKLSVWTEAKTAVQREENKNVLELAKRIRFERAQELLEGTEGYRLRQQQRAVNLIDFFRGYYRDYGKKDKGSIKVAFTRFFDFLADNAEYSCYVEGTHPARFAPARLTPAMVEEFTEYLKGRSRGGGAHTIFARFKKMVSAAVKGGLLRGNPCDGIRIPVDVDKINKAILTTEEVQTLHRAHFRGERDEMRRAFLFCCYTGVRFCDVKELRYSNFDRSARLLTFEQAKTAGRSSHSGVTIPLTDSLLTLIGEPREGGENSLVFNLPPANTCLRHLKRWAAAAGIPKNITWHSARHSFAVNILNGGANIKTVSTLLGHSSISVTEHYTHAVDSLKVAAMESLPPLL